MENDEDPSELERRLEQVTRLSSSVTDPTTVERFQAFAANLRLSLRRALERRKARQKERMIRERARELWEQHGQPAGRDEEFWLRAEAEIDAKEQD